MAQRATSLGPEPSLFYLFLFFCFPFFVFLFFLPPHLALNPPYFICFCLFFVFVCFLVFAPARKKLVSPLKRACLCIFSVSPFVSLLPCFTFSFLSLSLSLCLLFLFFSCFLPFCFSFLFLVLAFLFVFFAFFF